MSLETRGQGVLLCGQLFLLVQELFLLSDQPTDAGAQVDQLFPQDIYGFQGVGFFAFVMPGQALQQGFRLMVRMLATATDRARLVVLQLFAQLLDTRAAGEALTLQQLLGDCQGLLGDLEFILGLNPLAVEVLALLLGVLLFLCKRQRTGVEFLLLCP